MDLDEALEDELDSDGNALPNEWTIFELPNVLPRANPLMAKLKNSTILILGGYNDGSGGEFSDGVIFDTNARQVTSTICGSDFRFMCWQNQHCVTGYAKVVALITDPED